MKIFEMFDCELRRRVGILLCYEKSRDAVIELDDDLNEWNCPLLFTGFVKKGEFTIPREISMLWIRERIIPQGRQNINDILSNHKMKEYDEFKLLELSKGICSQDSIQVRKLDEAPQYILERQRKNLTEAVMLNDNDVLCFFVDGKVKKVSISSLSECAGIDKVIKNRKLFLTGKVGPGGYSLTYNDSIDVPSSLLYENGADLPLSIDDFSAFVRQNVFDATDTGNELECSRQNIAYMVKQGQLTPIREEVKGNLYLKGEVIKNKW